MRATGWLEAALIRLRKAAAAAQTQDQTNQRGGAPFGLGGEKRRRLAAKKPGRGVIKKSACKVQDVKLARAWLGQIVPCPLSA